MSSATGVNGKQKRNKPCESCRSHRRKCTVNAYGTNCDRCKRLAIPCLFKLSGKPSIAKPNSSNSNNNTECAKPKRPSRRPLSQLKKSRLSEKVRVLQQQITAMEDQLQSLSVYTQSDKHTWREFWSLVVTRGIQGDLSLDTSVQSVGELQSFLEQTCVRFFTPDITRIYYTPHGRTPQGSLTVKYQTLGVEQIFFKLIRHIPSSNRSACSIDSLPAVAVVAEAAEAAAATRPYEMIAKTSNGIDDENPAFVFVKQNLINVFFGCHGYLSPTLVRTHFLDYLESHPNSMLANAMVAFVACSLCRHVKLINLPFTRQELGLACMAKARKQLEDALFDEDEPSIEKMTTMWLLANSLLASLRNKEARTMISMAWRMGIQLKDVYLPILRQLDDPVEAPKLDPVTAAKAETFRRTFYEVRYIESSMYMIYDGLVDFTSIVNHSKVGYPKILPEEKGNPMLSKAVEIFRYLITLSVLPSGCDTSTPQEIIGQRLMAGALTEVSCADIEFIEKRVIEFWRSLPREYVLAESPLGLLDSITVQQCTDPNILFLNKMYYVYWMVLHGRFMEDPAKADMVNSSLGRMDSERALLIVSIASDAITKLSAALYSHMPCAVEIHWLVLVADGLRKLTSCQHPGIKARAEHNLSSILSILQSCMQHIFIDNPDDNPDDNLGFSDSPFFDSRSTVSADGRSSRSGSPATPPCSTAALSPAYFKELKRQIGAILTANHTNL